MEIVGVGHINKCKVTTSGSPCSQKLLRSPRKPTRKISKIPFKVLDAPELQDDFYLNLVDWSSLNVLSVGLGTCVYLWSACTSQVGMAELMRVLGDCTATSLGACVKDVSIAGALRLWGSYQPSLSSQAYTLSVV